MFTVEGPGPLLVWLLELGTTVLTAGSCSAWAANLGFKVGTSMHFAVQAMSIYGKYEHGAIDGVIDALLSSALSRMLDKFDDLTAAADFSDSELELSADLSSGRGERRNYW